MSRRLCTIALLAILSACASTPGKGPSGSAPGQNTDVGFTFGPGDGLSLETAVVIHAQSEMAGVPAERAWISQYYPQARPQSQELIASGGRHYDAIGITTSDGKELKVYFDISAFFGKL